MRSIAAERRLNHVQKASPLRSRVQRASPRQSRVRRASPRQSRAPRGRPHPNRARPAALRAARRRAAPRSTWRMTTCQWDRRWSTGVLTIIRIAPTSTLTGLTTTATGAATPAGDRGLSAPQRSATHLKFCATTAQRPTERPGMRPTICAIACLIGAMLAPQPATALDYPTRPVKIIVPFTAGGAPDVLMRLLGQKLSEKWGQGVVVENR